MSDKKDNEQPPTFGQWLYKQLKTDDKKETHKHLSLGALCELIDDEMKRYKKEIAKKWPESK